MNESLTPLIPILPILPICPKGLIVERSADRRCPHLQRQPTPIQEWNQPAV